jgi:hypothetical protein
MATAHVAGVAALLMSHFPNCTNNQIRNAMLNSASEPPPDDKRTENGWDQFYGWGIVDAGKAYEHLNTTGCVCAGGAYNTSETTLSDQALGGRDQKVIIPCTVSSTTKPNFRFLCRSYISHDNSPHLSYLCLHHPCLLKSKPTSKPTRKPTSKPTRTAWPTRKPTKKPTRKPTRKPTARPTWKPKPTTSKPSPTTPKPGVF